jgi:signal transduction histidine kinase
MVRIAGRSNTAHNGSTPRRAPRDAAPAACHGVAMADPRRTGQREAKAQDPSDVVPAIGRERVDVEAAAEPDVRAEDIMGATPDAVLGIDVDAVIRFASPAASRMFDYPPGALVGGSLEQLLPRGGRVAAVPLVKAFFAQPTPRQMGSGTAFAARRRGGEVFFVDYSLCAIESPAHGPLALLIVRDLSVHRHDRMMAAQHLITRALATSETLESAAPAVLEVIGMAAGANIAALWMVDPSGVVGFVDSWCASAHERPYHAESVDHVPSVDAGLLGYVITGARVGWSRDVLADPLFPRKDLARRVGAHAGIWVPLSDEDGRVVGVIELLFAAALEPDAGTLRILGDFAGQLAQYLALRRSQAARQRVLGQIVRSIEDERRRIASDLHDDTVQVLVASLMSIDRIERAVAPENRRAHDLLTALRSTLAEATERTRHLIFDLRPQLLEADGVAPAIAEVANLAGRDAGFEVEVHSTHHRFDQAVEALLYRVMQEAITNARKHSRARHLHCLVAPVADGVLGEVRDDGVGFRVDDALGRARQNLSFGLSTTVELVRLAGGRVDIRSSPGDGTVVSTMLPHRLTPRA